jgi:lipopolysaccharide/colanic/teichoic acid biosynthesis glycosyltransferase
VVGFLDDYLPAGSVVGNGLRVLGAPAALMQVAARTNADEAIVVPQALPWETLQTLLADTAAAPNGLRVHLPAGFYDLLTTRVDLSERNHVPLLTLKKARLTPFETVFKSSLDYSLASFLLVSLSPLLAAVALWLRLHDNGEVLQRRPVLGLYGRQFTLLSFSPRGPARSPFIRKLPALINVIIGDLSIVGPRPSELESHARRLAIRPGLTGSWRQVDDPEQQAVLDLYYIRSYSVWLDLQVLFQRVLARAGLRNDARTRKLVASIGIDELNVATASTSQLQKSPYLRVKRGLDVVVAAVLFAVSSPLLAGCLLAVWVDSGLPLIHRRRVIGKGGRTFDAFKLRTMVPNADTILEQDETLRSAFAASNKLTRDPRRTQAGRWLRRLSLDELPQLVNVLRGEMSLVGPRMITPAELPEWGETAALMLSVRPGLTGLWQVSGRQRLTKADRIRMDDDYVRRMSLRLDLTILARTVPAVLSSRGAF